MIKLLGQHTLIGEIETCNPVADSRYKLDFGRNLFFDTRLFEDSRRSCATCHNPKLAFTDGYRMAKAIKADPLTKNTPTLINVSQYRFFNWSRPDLTELEDQIKLPLYAAHPAEMGQQLKDFDWLVKDEKYKPILKKAYPNCQTVGAGEVLESLALYCSSLEAIRSRYDIFRETGDSSAISKDALAGMKLFYSDEFSCANCHNGLYFSVATTDRANESNSFFYTGVNKELTDKIRVPSLRNLAFTKPYFHDGSANNLKDVILHYADGGKMDNPPSGMAKKIDINTEVIRQLSAFLLSLSDSTSITYDLCIDKNTDQIMGY